MKQICRYLLLSLFVLLLSGCSKDNNPMIGTSWESRNATGLWTLSQYYDGDFSEIMKFDESQVHDVIIRDGHTFRDKGWYDYRYEGDDSERVVVDRGDNEAEYYIYGNTMYRASEVWYKQ